MFKKRTFEKPSFPQTKWRKTQVPSGNTCFLCGEKDYFKKDCPKNEKKAKFHNTKVGNSKEKVSILLRELEVNTREPSRNEPLVVDLPEEGDKSFS